MRIGLWIALLFAIWLILTNSIAFSNIAVGLIVSVSIALLYTKSFKSDNVEMISPYWLGVYIVVFLKNIILSNIQISKRILRKDMRLAPAIVAVKTDLKSDWKKLLLANSITLTPGTLTLDVKGDTLYIHTIEYDKEKSKEEIIKEFQDVIARI
ncbi:MAG: Na+/H+ antiporter subunit E [Campylobacterota bacterium]|nr:Na+/H+ antiporter subunit E [Campylobacterota bacterium]